MKGIVLDLTTHHLQPVEDDKNAAAKVVWRGEVVSWKFQLVAMSKAALSVRLRSVDGSLESTIEEPSIKLLQVQTVHGHIGRGDTWGVLPQANIPRVAIPDRLVPVPLDATIASGIYWLQWQVPDNCAPGRYVLEVDLVTEETTESSRNLVLPIEVVPLRLPQTAAFSLELWQYPYTVARYYQVEPFSPQHIELLRAHLQLYRAVGGRVLTATITEDPWHHQTYDAYPSMVQWTRTTQGTFQLDFSQLDQYIQLGLEIGVADSLKLFSITPWEHQVTYWDEATQQPLTEMLIPGTRKWQSTWHSVLVQVVFHLHEKGWLNRSYLAMDEQSPAVMKAVIELVDEVCRATGLSIQLSAALNGPYTDTSLMTAIADVSFSMDVFQERSRLKEAVIGRLNSKQQTTMYTMTGQYPNLFSRSEPIEAAWTVFYAAGWGLNGYLRWALNAWPEDPLLSIDHWYWESGDPFLIYPGADGIPTTSPRFEWLRIAMQTLAKWTYLQQHAPSLAQEVSHELANWHQPEGQVNLYGAMESPSTTTDAQVRSQVQSVLAVVERMSLLLGETATTQTAASLK